MAAQDQGGRLVQRVKPIQILNTDGRNQTETRYELQVLKPRLLAGEIQDYRFDGMKLRLAKTTFYTPDYVVITQQHVEFHEVKGYWQDDARVKIKVAAAQYPWFKFIAVSYKKNRWITEEF